MPTEYQTFVGTPDILKEGQEIKLAVKDLSPGPRKYDCRIVKALVARDPQKLPGSDVLWLRSLVGRRFPEPWAIKITEELGDSMPVTPYQLGIEVTKILNEDLG
ncbi:MAG: hypothetical protein PVI20_05465 [Desulfobacteraceae bacterium]|jgi:hypothetical protein